MRPEIHITKAGVYYTNEIGQTEWYNTLTELLSDLGFNLRFDSDALEERVLEDDE